MSTRYYGRKYLVMIMLVKIVIFQGLHFTIIQKQVNFEGKLVFDKKSSWVNSCDNLEEKFSVSDALSMLRQLCDVCV
jgi:hypothetical protein